MNNKKMRRLFLGSAAAVCLLAGSCSKDAFQMPASQPADGTERFYLSDETTEGAADRSTRAAFTGGYRIAWEAGDAVAVARTSSYPLQQDAAGKWYVDLPAADAYKVWYPAASYDGDKLGSSVVKLNEVQNYRAGSFDPAALCARAIGAPGEKLVFKYLCSVMKLTLKGTAAEQVKQIRLSTENLGEERIGHGGVLAENADGTASLAAMTGIYASLSYNYVVLNAPDVALTAEGVDFYVTLFPTTFSEGFTLTITLADGRVMTKKGGVGQTARRGKILAMPALHFE